MGDFGLTPGFQENLEFGAVSGDLGPQKAVAQIANLISPYLRHSKNSEKVKSIAFGGGHSFSIACREIAQIVSGQNVGSMHVKRSDPEKD